MKILNLSLDNSILNKNSHSSKRIVEYGELVEKYTVIVSHNENKIVDLSEKTKVYGIKLLQIPMIVSRLFALLQIYKLASKLVKSKKYSVITIQDPFELGLVGLLIAKKYKIGLNIQEHGDFFSQKYWRNENIINFIRYYLGKFVIKKADSVRVVSKRIENNLIEKLNIKKEKIVNMPVYTELKNKDCFYQSQKKEINNNANKIIFLWAGRFVKQKNLPMLIMAFSNVLKKYPNLILRIIGSGLEKKKIIELIKKNNIKNNIEIFDWIDDIDIEYDKADAYILSSNYEGWGRVIIEAASHGLPSIMTDVGCAGEIIKDSENGIIIPVGNQKKLEEAMIKLIKDEYLRNKLGKNALQTVVKLPSKEQILKLYKKSWKKSI